jgi:hypothetical protein
MMVGPSSISAAQGPIYAARDGNFPGGRSQLDEGAAMQKAEPLVGNTSEKVGIGDKFPT